MAKLIGQETVNGLTESWYYDETSDSIHVQRSQDVEATIDRIAAINAAGEAPNVEGLGRCIGEVDIGVAMDYCARRGIPWEKFLYTNEYDSEWPAIFAENKRLRYERHGKAVAAH